MSVTMTGYPRCQAPGHNNIMARDDKQNCYHSRITDGHTLVTGIHLNPRPSLQREHPLTQQVTNKDKRISEFGSNM